MKTGSSVDMITQRKTNSVNLLWLFGVVLLYGLAIWLLFSVNSPLSILRWRESSSPDALAAFEEKTGVRVARVSLTAGAGMIDLRYQVIDPDKAVILHDPQNPPAVIDEKTGKVFDTPWMDHSHKGELHAGVTYYTLLMNSGRVLSKGSKVTVVLGGIRLEHWVVQ